MGKVLTVATVASNLSQFDRENLKIIKDMGYDIHIACNFNEGNSWSEESENDFRDFLKDLDAEIFDIEFPRDITNIKAIRNSYKSLLKTVKEHNYDLIHCHTPVASVICRMVARKTGVKVMYTAHGFHFFKGAPLKNNLLFKTVERAMAKNTDMLITMNDEDTQAAEKFKLRKGGCVRYIPGIGVDVDEVKNRTANREDLLAELDIPADSTVIMTVAELIERKNYKASIDAFAKVNNQNTYYLVCGAGPLEDELKAQARELGVENRIRFLGFRTDVYELLKTCDIFLFISHQEGLPVAIMEAMAAGLPVIASDIRGNRELIDNGKGGYVVDRIQIDAIARSIENLSLDRDLCRDMGEYNQAKINDFSLEKVNELMRENYAWFLTAKDKEDENAVHDSRPTEEPAISK